MDFQLVEKDMCGDVENDEELMAELLALEAEERADSRRDQSTAQVSLPANGVYGISSISDISDEDIGSSDGEDVKDPELLAELSDLIREEVGDACEVGPPSSSGKPTLSKASYEPPVDTVLLRKLHELKEEYAPALMAAQEKNDISRTKRYQRALGKIEELVRRVQAGKIIDEDDIPVSIKAIRSGELHEKVASVSTPPEPKVEPVLSSAKQITEKEPCEPLSIGQKSAMRLLKGEQLRAELTSRRESYLRNAGAANARDKKRAYEYYVVVKQFDEAIKAMNDGQVTECEESELPPPAVPYKSAQESLKHEQIPPPPKTLVEGLQQRIQKYKSICDQNRMENDDRKYRMNVRILNRYEDALKACRSNKPVDISGLPCPPGYPPLPIPGNIAVSTNGMIMSRKPLPEVGPFAAPEPVSGRQSRQKQQLDFLLKRRLQFKEAAIASKKRGDITAAKKFLLVAKGLDRMIAASKNGLPVNIEKTPVPPQVRASAKTLKPSLERHTSFDAAVKGTPTEIFAVMERDLLYQVKLCEDYMLAFTRMGDVTRVKLFETWSANSKRDLILLRELAKRDAAVPQFRYETRKIPSVEVCFEVDENQLELTIVKVIEAKLPAGWKSSDGYLFVKYNFAFPHDAHQTGRTKVIAGTNSPEFNQKFLLSINRKTKQLQRVIKRNCLKFEIYQKGGFLRSDKLIATADCKLTDLEEKVHIHESIDLMEGRKQTGGKLNYQVRIREPLGEKKLLIMEKKWLVLEV